MYLMFEALGKVDDRELMLVNLDLLDITDANTFSSQKLNFILFNPTPAGRSATITIPAARERTARLTAAGKPIGGTFQIAGRSFLQLQAEF
jgi:hypothetical protein